VRAAERVVGTSATVGIDPADGSPQEK
jgi:hypothetical protein